MGTFGKNTDSTSSAPPQTTAVTIVGAGTSFVGEIKGGRPVRIEGSVKGTIDVSSSLEIARGATVEAEIRAISVRVSGRLVGNIVASETVELLSTADITGDLSTPSLHVVEGAEVNGRVTMQAVSKTRTRAASSTSKS